MSSTDLSSQSSIPLVLHTRVMAGSGGGPEKTIMNSARYLDPQRYQMAAAYLHNEGDEGFLAFQQKATEAGCEMLGIPERRALDFKALKAMRQLCQEREVKIWHGHDYKSNLFGLLIKRKMPELRLVTTVHLWTEETTRLKLYRKIDEWCLPRYEHVICVSQALADRCAELGVPDERLHMIHNGIETDRWQRSQCPSEAREKLGLDPARFTVGFIARFSVQKALDRWVAIAKLIKEHTDLQVQFLLIGEGPEKENLVKWFTKAGLMDDVIFPGWQQNLQPWYEALDFMLMTSLREGLPNTLLEAMAMGVPSACTEVGAVSALYGGGESGLLINPDPEMAFRTIKPLLENTEALAEMAVAARAIIESEFSFVSRMKKVEAIYDRLDL